jgi:hypothetical protein
MRSVAGRHEANVRGEVEEKPFTSSLSICPEACFRKGWGARGVTPPLLQPRPISVTIFGFPLSSVPDPWHFGTDPDPRLSISDYRIRNPDPALFVGDEASRCFKLFDFYFLNVHLHHFSHIKSYKEVTKQ